MEAERLGLSLHGGRSPNSVVFPRRGGAMEEILQIMCWQSLAKCLLLCKAFHAKDFYQYANMMLDIMAIFEKLQ